MYKIFSSILLLSVFTASCDASSRAARLMPGRIINGTAVPPGAVPYIVAMEHKGKQVCGGQIIGPSSILTAAHCCAGDVPSTFTISAGVNNLNNPEPGAQLHVPVTSYTIHPDFNPDTFVNDVCVMCLGRPLKLSKEYRTAQCLLPPNGDYRAAGDATTCGWGDTNPDVQSNSPVLLCTDVPIVPDPECQADYSGINPIVDSEICAGRGEKDSCVGDSGGPLVDNYGLCVGIVSGGLGCAEPMFPGVYTEIAYFLDFINSVKCGRYY